MQSNKVLPSHAKRIFKATFDNAYEEYDLPEERYKGESRKETASKVAWSAVKKAGYAKSKSNSRWEKI